MVNRFFASLGNTWKGLIALSGAFIVGVTLTLFMSGFVGLPERVDVLEIEAESTQTKLKSLEENSDLTVCLLDVIINETPALECRR